MKRQRGRGRKGGGNSGGNRAMESNGPDVKVRGAASTIHEKYLQLHRDASSSGDRVKAENYLQHAEHYFRIMQAQDEQRGNRQDNQSRGGGNNQNQNQNQNQSKGGNNSQNQDNSNSAKDEKSDKREEEKVEAKSGDQPKPRGRKPKSDDQGDQGERKPRRAARKDEGGSDPLGVVTPEESGELGQPSGDQPKRRGRPRKSEQPAEGETDSGEKKEAANA